MFWLMACDRRARVRRRSIYGDFIAFTGVDKIAIERVGTGTTQPRPLSRASGPLQRNGKA